MADSQNELENMQKKLDQLNEEKQIIEKERE